MKNITRITLLSIVLGSVMFGQFQAQAALDAANDAAYNTTWTGGENGGTGFGAWTITGAEGGGLGSFIGSSTGNDASDINVGGESFGLSDDEVATAVTASRAISSAMSAGDIFNVRLDPGSIQSLAQVGFTMNNGGTMRMALRNVNSQAFYQIIDSTTTATSIPVGSDVDVSITITGANTYDISLNGGAFTASRTFTGSGQIDGVSFVNQGAGPDPGDAFYFNSMEIVPVPEPAVTAGLACAVLLGAVLVRARRVGLRVQN